MESLNKIILLFIVIVLTSCAKQDTVIAPSKVVMSEHRLQNGMKYWVASKDGISVEYYADDCALAEKILYNVVKDANEGRLDWNKMSNYDYRKAELFSRCFLLETSILRLQVLQNIELDKELRKNTDDFESAPIYNNSTYPNKQIDENTFYEDQ